MLQLFARPMGGDLAEHVPDYGMPPNNPLAVLGFVALNMMGRGETAFVIAPVFPNTDLRHPCRYR